MTPAMIVAVTIRADRYEPLQLLRRLVAACTIGKKASVLNRQRPALLHASRLRPLLLNQDRIGPGW